MYVVCLWCVLRVCVCDCTRATSVFKELERLYTTKKNKTEAFNAWCTKHVDEKFPKAGEVAYTVPHCFIGTEDITVKDEDAPALKQESDTRADHAHRKVERAFSVSNILCF